MSLFKDKFPKFRFRNLKKNFKDFSTYESHFLIPKPSIIIPKNEEWGNWKSLSLDASDIMKDQSPVTPKEEEDEDDYFITESEGSHKR